MTIGEFHCFRMSGIYFLFVLFPLFLGINSVIISMDNSSVSVDTTNAFQTELSNSSTPTLINPSSPPSITTSSFPEGPFKFIDLMLKNYDKRVWPTYGTKNPTLVKVNLNINSMGSFRAADMDFDMDIYLRQSWVDPRLQLQKYNIMEKINLNGQDLADKIWKPDTFFRNLKTGAFHLITAPNQLIQLSPNGTILFSMRLTLKMSCQMSFRLYPLDAQKCWINLGSYAQTLDQVFLKWREIQPITIEKNIEIPEFIVSFQTPGNFTRVLDTGTFSFLNVSFFLSRQNGYHLIQTYLPTFLVVMMSWISFWVPVEAAPARTALGLTNLLTLMTVGSGVRTQLPPVSYAKAIDIWFGACTLMVFSALVEFAVASYLTRLKIRHNTPKISWIILQKRENIETERNHKEKSPEDDKKIQLRRSHAVDRYSRIFFPIIFVAFNMCYWTYYLSERSNIESDMK